MEQVTGDEGQHLNLMETSVYTIWTLKIQSSYLCPSEEVSGHNASSGRNLDPEAASFYTGREGK